MNAKPRFKLAIANDNDTFAQQICEALDQGYILHGAPSLSVNDGERTLMQALLLPQPRGDRGDFGGRKPFRKFDDHGGGGGFRGGDRDNNRGGGFDREERGDRGGDRFGGGPRRPRF